MSSIWSPAQQCGITDGGSRHVPRSEKWGEGDETEGHGERNGGSSKVVADNFSCATVGNFAAQACLPFIDDDQHAGQFLYTQALIIFIRLKEQTFPSPAPSLE